ncbi:natural resistance-associated macrophage protein-domain-containing protein [Mycotypha africana]|uniref:natural resistance-associated macrophage protein-domain-containing protein n=1 Tax=Mycotypha africana TaxID=64632 RepID=UPI00230041D0|nr:natural resistance-associated macrophage protein-domain-containing protein [Mycotypha africana]KAI8975590.1 natural resistance-associated macrophage protein-domain-containing protein [Mycotypha africana]
MRDSSTENEASGLLHSRHDSSRKSDYRSTLEWNVEIDVKGEVNTGHEEENGRFSFRKLMTYTGPDPGNLESDLQVGSVAGYKLLWLLFWSHVAGLAIQILSARLGVVTQNHLAQLIRSDIQEIIGTAIALKIIFRLDLWVGVMITATDTFFFMFLQQYGVRKIEAFFITLIGVMIACFWIEMLSSNPSFQMILKGILIPELPEQAKVQAVGMVGAVIMPHNMFLHSALVMSRNLGKEPSKMKKKEANFYFAVESTIALFISYLINLAIVVVFAQVFYDPGRIVTKLPGLYDASIVLSNTLGKSAKYFWALGLLAAGQCSTMTGTLAGQYVVEGFMGAIFKKQWHRVALTRAVALLPSMCVAVLAVDRFDTMGEILNVLQSLCLPTAIIPILKLTSAEKIMTKTFKNSRLTNFLCWSISIIVIIFNIYLFLNYLEDLDWPLYGVAFCILYLVFVIYLIYIPLNTPVQKEIEEVHSAIEEDINYSGAE